MTVLSLRGARNDEMVVNIRSAISAPGRRKKGFSGDFGKFYEILVVDFARVSLNFG